MSSTRLEDSVSMQERRFIRDLIASDPTMPSTVELAAGDDMAVLRVGGERVLAAIDAVVEGRHFRAGADPRLVGRKALLRNLSDVAAMAAKPLACLASVTLPRSADQSLADALLEGRRSAATEHGCPLVGGDTSLHAGEAPLTLSVAILATPALPSGRTITRRGAKLGDLVSVTGSLGGSLDADGGGRHLDFPPRLAEAIELAGALGDRLHSMIDVSDGLGVDAAHLVEHDDSLAIELDADSIPARAGCSIEQALGDGEDFELLFISEGTPPSEVAGTAVSVIGRVIERGSGSGVRLRIGDRITDVAERGFEHASGAPR
ncbi:MAG: thiamine-phosphate kinase [Phycisphaerales bacterium]